MALETDEVSHVELVELEEFEAIEIDEALLRELLEEQADDGVGEFLEETVQKKDNKMMDIKQQDQKQQLEGSTIDFHFDQWMNNNTNNNNNNNMNMNWYPDDDMVGMMVDFGFINNNEEFGSQVSEGIISYETSYGCLWHDL